MKTLPSIAALAAAWLGSASPAAAVSHRLSTPFEAAAICGRVTSFTGEAVPAATVVLEGQNMRRETTTAEDGRYCFESFPGGSYAINVRAMGYQGARQQIQVAKDQQQRVDFTLTIGAVR